MKETSSDLSDIDPKRSGAIPAAYGFFDRPTTPSRDPQPLNEQTVSSSVTANSDTDVETADGNNCHHHLRHHNHHPPHANKPRSPDAAVVDEKPDAGSLRDLSGQQLPFTASSKDEGQGTVVDILEGSGSLSPSNNDAGSPKEGEESGNSDSKKKQRTFFEELRRTLWLIITHSWMNVLLVFVPLGIVLAQIDGVHGGVIFTMNCIAVIPLASLLSYATESVARKMGDALGALLNVTFGNAVELIIFIIALVKDEIRIVQASLLGSILANLLLILGMGFFLGGLRYREQVYNSTVTQMSACLLSLSVISLVLPTAFHASFSDSRLADIQSLKISRGTSVILLLVYVIYLLFQLKSHAYMYESTPQHIVDAESIPGPAAAWLDSSSSDSSTSDNSDSDDSSHSRDTVQRKIKKVFRRRKLSVASAESNELEATRTSSFRTIVTSPQDDACSETLPTRPRLPRLSSAEANVEEAVDDEERGHRHRRPSLGNLRNKYKKKKKKRHDHHHTDAGNAQPTISEQPESASDTRAEEEPRHIDFAVRNGVFVGSNANEAGASASPKRAFPALRSMSVKNLAPTVFVQKPELGVSPPAPAGPVPRVRYGIRRTNSLPDRLSHHCQLRAPGAMLPTRISLAAVNRASRPRDDASEDEDEEHLCKWASVILLLVTTGLVAACAEFLIGSIEAVTSSSSIGEIFIGLIVLPIVGNAAEHVTAITVAMKNKMDLAIGVAVGSSIQIAIFVTPLVVILGWIMDKEMSLYFTLFETVCLFVSAFMVNFLVLDGRSNYLEGALLCAVYCIIGVVAFFYPDGDAASSWGG